MLEKGALKTGMPSRGGGGEVDLVGADAEGADRLQVGRGLEDAPRHIGLRADAQQLHSAQGVDQFGLVERSLDGFDLDPALGEQPDAFRMDVFQQ